MLLLCYTGHLTDLNVFGARFRDRRGTFVAAAAGGVAWITFDGVFVKMLDPGVVLLFLPSAGPAGSCSIWLPAAQAPTGHDTLQVVLAALPGAPAVQAAGIPIDTGPISCLPRTAPRPGSAVSAWSSPGRVGSGGVGTQERGGVGRGAGGPWLFRMMSLRAALGVG